MKRRIIWILLFSFISPIYAEKAGSQAVVSITNNLSNQIRSGSGGSGDMKTTSAREWISSRGNLKFVIETADNDHPGEAYDWIQVIDDSNKKFLNIRFTKINEDEPCESKLRSGAENICIRGDYNELVSSYDLTDGTNVTVEEGEVISEYQPIHVDITVNSEEGWRSFDSINEIDGEPDVKVSNNI
ncbi:hypothetical protein [Francisella sciaenopsi]|uniref:Uncharacterized protein n=1 Tax=Francisella sciaenopsi TaxID=3055034 RepID=A0ABQ6PHZ9_9GAMM